MLACDDISNLDKRLDPIAKPFAPTQYKRKEMTLNAKVSEINCIAEDD